jgi:hypothetical protein
MRSLLAALIVVLVFGSLMCLASTVSAAPVALFQDDFESYAVGATMNGLVPPVGAAYASGFVPPGPSVANASTQPIPGAGNTGQFMCDAGVASMDTLATLTADAQTASVGQVFTVSFDMFVNQGTGTAAGFAAYKTFYSQNIFDVYPQRDGTVQYYNNGDTTLQTATGTFATGQWIPVQIVADTVAKTYSVNVGGVTFGDSFNSASDRLASVYLNPHDVTSFDNLLITVPVPEPSTVLLMLAGLFGLLAYAWRKRR